MANPASLAGFAGAVGAGASFAFKNRIINGDMRIDQRNSGASVTPTDGQYTLDRWYADLTAASKFTVQLNAGSVTPPTGFTNYLGVTSSSAYSITSTSIFTVSQRIEGFNAADFAWGTSSASSATLSFLVRSSLTGTFGGSLRSSGNGRCFPFSFTVSAANTWEYKTIVVPGETSGTWLTNNSTGIGLSFGLGVGSTYSGTAGSWSSSLYFSSTGATSVVGTNGATFYITGVQLEKGSVATPFEFRSIGQELALCQRYFYRSGGTAAYQSHGIGVLGSTQLVDAPFWYPVPFRATPSLTVNNLASFVSAPGGTPTSIVLQDAASTNNNQLLLRWAIPTPSTIGYAARLYSLNNAAATLDFSAEL